MDQRGDGGEEDRNEMTMKKEDNNGPHDRCSVLLCSLLPSFTHDRHSFYEEFFQ